MITLRQLNRATLARQMLLERQTLSAPAAIEQLGGLQAQLPQAPFIGLWTRLQDFRRSDLAQAIADRQVVKATWLRATLHLCTAADYLHFRATLRPALTAAANDIARRSGEGFDLDALLAAARTFLAEKPRTFAEISSMIGELAPGQDVGPMRYAIRTHLPLVQVPVTGGWSYPGNPQFTLAEAWLGRPIPEHEDLPGLVLRYLAAFGPASAADMQTWSGLPQLKEAFEALRPQLQMIGEYGRRQLFDLPGRPLPSGDEEAPVRFLPEFDNLLLSHSKRTRVIADEHRGRVFLPGLRVAATILVDGFVAGVWKIETGKAGRGKRTATLVIEPFAALAPAERTALTEEGERLVRFVVEDAAAYAVQFSD